MMYYTIAAGIFCGAVIAWYLATFNLLVQSRNAVDHSWSNIEVELNRRFDLIQNLVEIAKGYARHEFDTFSSVAALRGQEHRFTDATQANGAQRELSRALAHVMIVAENYPELRAAQSFLDLQAELTTTEDRIAERRLAYNQNVNLYQNRCQFFPQSLVAGLHQFAPKMFFDAPDELVNVVPKVALS